MLNFKGNVAYGTEEENTKLLFFQSGFDRPGANVNKLF